MNTKKKKAGAKKMGHKKLDFNYRLLAFGAMASNALFQDILNSKNMPLKKAASNFNGSKPNFADSAKTYLKTLGFPASFVDAGSKKGMPWDLVNRSGILAIRAIVEADGDDYPDGGCLEAIMAALYALGPIKP
jgi:hypothetical protein